MTDTQNAVARVQQEVPKQVNAPQSSVGNWKKWSWYRTTLSARVLMLLAAVTIALLCSLMFLASGLFQSDKISYIYDIHDLKTERLSQQLRAKLELVAKDAQPLDDDHPIAVLDSEGGDIFALKIPRIPNIGEIFIGSLTDAANPKVTVPFLITRGSNGQLKSKTLTKELKQTFASEVRQGKTSKDDVPRHSLFWLTSFGSVVSANLALPADAKTLTSRPLIKAYLTSSMTQGLITITDNDRLMIGGYREVTGTNTAVFIETPLSDALKPLRQFILLAFCMGLLVIFVGIFVTQKLLQSLWNPLRSLRQMTLRIAQGDYGVRSTHRFQDELLPVFAGIEDMCGMLQVRENTLNRFKQGLETVLQTSMEMALAQDQNSILKLAGLALMENVSMQPQSGIVASLIKQAREGYAIEHTLIIDQDKLLQDPIQNITQLRGSLADSSDDFSPIRLQKQEIIVTPEGEIIVPLQYGDKNFGTLRLRLYAFPVLDPVDKVFLEMIGNAVAVALENMQLRIGDASRIRLEADLETGQAVQSSLLRKPEDIFKHYGIDIATHYTPAERTGGDWFGYHLETRTDHLYFYVADVTGHGVASALMTGVTCGGVYALSQAIQELQSDGTMSAQTIDQRLVLLWKVLNQLVTEVGHKRYLMTMAFFGMDLKTGKVSYISAGHPAPFVLNGATQTVSRPMSQSHVLGAHQSEDISTSLTHFTVRPGDTILAYSDGLIENEGLNGEVLPERKIKKALEKGGHKTAQSVVDSLCLLTNDLWVAPVKDDTTLLAIRWSGAQS